MRLRIVPLLIGLAIVVLMPTPAGAAPGQGAVEAPDITATALRQLGDGTACVDFAKRAVAGAWVCQGDRQLSYVDQRGKRQTRMISGASTLSHAEHRSGTQTRSNSSGDLRTAAVGDDWDNWCESTGVCVRIVTSYRAEIKANDYYGWGDNTWGSFDEIWRQSFSGMRNRYRLTLIWDMGYAVDPDYFTAHVRYWRPGPDGYAGQATMIPGNISANGQKTIYPGKTKYKTVDTNAHNRTTTHHDDLTGSFFANDRYFHTGTLRLPNFKCPKGHCRYQ